MDLLSILPDFPTKPYAHILPPLERNQINTVDLISLDTLEIAKRAHVPPADVRRLSNHVVKALHHDLGFEECPSSDQEEPSSSLNLDIPVFPGPGTKLDLSRWCTISTLDPPLDGVLSGGIPIGYVTEVTGESGSGKTQFLLSLLLAVQLPQPRGAGRGAIYISTEAPLATTRLSQLLESHPYLSSLPRDRAPSLGKILSINAMDLEAQDHILNYQLPVAIKRYHVGLVVIDSITSNYRAEHTTHNLSGLSTRSGELVKLGQMLRNLAVKEDIAIVVANQVSDRFEGEEGSSHFLRRGVALAADDVMPSSSSPSTQKPQQRVSIHHDSGLNSPSTRARPLESGNVELMQHTLTLPSSTAGFPSSSPFGTQEDPQAPFDGSYLVGNPVRNEILSLHHQQRFFTGWGDTGSQYMTPSAYPVFQRSTPKTPALGLVWSTQIACRIALKKEDRLIETAPESGPGNRPFDPHPPGPEYGPSKEEKIQLPENTNGTPGSDGSPNISTCVDEGASEPRPLATAPTTANRNPANLQMAPSPQIIERGTIRRMKLVFAPWTAGSAGGSGGGQDGMEFEIWKGGLRSCSAG